MPTELDRETLLQTGVATAGATARGPMRRWRCTVVAGPDHGRDLVLDVAPLIVGARKGCGLVLNDSTVSGQHLELAVTLAGVSVRDLGSSNGTYLHGNRVEQVVISEDALLELGQTRLRVSCKVPPALAPSTRHRFGGLVGDSLAMRELFAVLELAAPTDVTVLVQGESGTGKELIARALHDHSMRAAAPFVIVDCSAVSEHLLDSQLFGHRRGAFTGATSDRRGAFVEASGGTLFIDEIGELPLQSQGKLLRALEHGAVQPLGSDRPAQVEARVVAATHRDLYRMVCEGSFRFDLYHRIAVVNVYVPPLRERPEDLPSLVRAFYEGREADPGPIDGENLRALSTHDWPGNGRELRNVLERAWVFAGRAKPTFRDLRLWLTAGERRPTAQVDVDPRVPLKDARRGWLEVLERQYLAGAYEAHERNLSRASRAVGIGRRHLRALLVKYGIIEA